MTAPATYRGTITREQWLVDETRVIARLMMEEGLTSDAELIERVTSQNLFQYPTEREQASITRACARRLCALSDDPQTRHRPRGARHARPTQPNKPLRHDAR